MLDGAPLAGTYPASWLEWVFWQVPYAFTGPSTLRRGPTGRAFRHVCMGLVALTDPEACS
jgi:hypothetical protein